MTEDIKFHQQSVELFGNLNAEYFFKDRIIRKQLKEIIAYHQKKIIQAKDEIKFCKQIIEKINTPFLTPDGKVI